MRNISGEGGGLTKSDERQKQIFRSSAIVSWQTLIFYALLRLLSITPLFNQLFVNEKSSILLSYLFFKSGGDILTVGILGYVIGFLGSYLKLSKI
jgi:hypothetical protein